MHFPVKSNFGCKRWFLISEKTFSALHSKKGGLNNAPNGGMSVINVNKINIYLQSTSTGPSSQTIRKSLLNSIENKNVEAIPNILSSRALNLVKFQSWYRMKAQICKQP